MQSPLVHEPSQLPRGNQTALKASGQQQTDVPKSQNDRTHPASAESRPLVDALAWAICADNETLTVGAETAGMATPGLAALLLALASFFGAGIFYGHVACEKIPGLRQIPMEWWEETKFANRFHPT